VSDLRQRLEAAIGAAGGESTDFDLNPEVVLPANRKLREAAVLAAFMDVAGEPRVLLTMRSSALKHHPGQIAFPGGKRDPGDATLVDTALREAHEEIALEPGNVEVLGTLPPHETVTGFTMTPVIGLVKAPFTPVPEAGECAEIFTVPAAHVLDTGRYSIQWRRWRGSRRYYYTVPFGPYYIWGATARVLRNLAERMAV